MKDEMEMVQGDANGFRPVDVVPEPLHEADREAARSGYRVFRASDGFEAAVAEQVIERAFAIGKVAAPNEWYGILVGRLYRDARGAHVVVLGLVHDSGALAAAGYVETTHASEFRTRTLARLLFPDAMILGWIHGHTGHGARYSATDRRNQATWTQAHAIGIVVDPFHRTDLGVYRGPAAELLELVARDGAPNAPHAPALGAGEDMPRRRSFPLAAPRARRTPLLTVSLAVGLAVALGGVLAVVVLDRRVRSLEARVREAEDRDAQLRATINAVVDTLPPDVCPDMCEAASCASREENR